MNYFGDRILSYRYNLLSHSPGFTHFDMIMTWVKSNSVLAGKSILRNIRWTEMILPSIIWSIQRTLLLLWMQIVTSDRFQVLVFLLLSLVDTEYSCCSLLRESTVSWYFDLDSLIVMFIITTHAFQVSLANVILRKWNSLHDCAM